MEHGLLNIGHLRTLCAAHCWANVRTQPILHMKRPNYFQGLSLVPVPENKNKGFLLLRLAYTWIPYKIVKIGAQVRCIFAASSKLIEPKAIESNVCVSRQLTEIMIYEFDQIFSLAAGARQNFQAVVRGKICGMSHKEVSVDRSITDVFATHCLRPLVLVPLPLVFSHWSWFGFYDVGDRSSKLGPMNVYGRLGFQAP